MTQKEAVKRLLAWLPHEAYCTEIDPLTARNVHAIWAITKSLYSSNMVTPYHFSRVPCKISSLLGSAKDLVRERFLQTPCICIKVSKHNHIIWFKEHLPYKGDCHE